MENKYYKPTIEEFHVGFEFYHKEIKYTTTAIDSSRKNNGVLASPVGSKKRVEFRKELGTFDSIRVKHLNKEDIESFGFNHVGDNLNGTMPVYLTSVTTINHNFPTRLMSNDTTTWELSNVDKDVEGSDKYILFRGTIKNKSELKRILTQVGVLNSSHNSFGS